MNHLKNETSPYLLEHAANPVDWHPWCEEALQLAKEQNKPILLSIGYSACHWCHVMAYESFEDEEIASLMNKHFINIKVDREERPDLDKIYQLTHQLITQRPGGWPLTMFLVPGSNIPFYGGTYFPKISEPGQVNFSMVLEHVAECLKIKADEVYALTSELKTALQQLSELPHEDGIILSNKPIQAGIGQLKQDMDHINGGFGYAPKFPHTKQLELLMQFEETEEFVELTLTNMAHSGLYDQIGGGFFRYSTDERWMIPHFEKMLYDNALLIECYAKAYARNPKPLYKRIIEETIDWLTEAMQAPSGGFYSTLNADSEGAEGQYYVWQLHEVQDHLTERLFKAIKKHYGLDYEPNFEGQYHFYIHDTPDEDEFIREAKSILKSARNDRIPPGRDEKILAGWNGLMIKALTTAGAVLDRPDYIDCAINTAEMVLQNLWKNKRLFASYKDGETKYKAYLDDYAYMLDAIVTLTEVRNIKHLEMFAIDLADNLLSHFHDKQNGAFYFTSDDHEMLIQRPKTILDDATPSGNAIACDALLRLGYRLKNQEYLSAAQKTLEAAWEPINSYPAAHASFLLTLLKN